MVKLNEKQLKRLVQFGRRVWNLLTRKEQESYYNDRGTYGFVEDMMVVLDLHQLEFESFGQFECVHRAITKRRK